MPEEPAAPPRKDPRVPARVAAYVSACALVAAGLLVAGIAALAGSVAPATLGGGLAFAAVFYVLERQAIVLAWGRQRITSALTETAVLLGLLWLPAPLLVLAVPLPRAAMGLVTRRPFIKSTFNVAAGVLSVAAAWGAAALGQAMGLPLLAAAILGTIVYSLAAELVVSGLFGVIERTWFLRVYRTRFLRPNVLAMAYGVTAGLVLHALFSLHPLMVLAAAPLLLLLNRYASYEARADREITLYQRLARESQALIGCDSRDVIAQRAISLCLDCLGAAQVRLRLDNGASWARAEVEDERFADEPWLSTSILGREGRRLGEISAWRRPGRRTDPVHDEALLRIIAGQVGQALESAEALVEVARQRDVVARQEKLSALGSLVAGVAHEVNNPLTYLSGNVELALLDLEELERLEQERGEKLSVDVGETRRLLTTALGGAQRIGDIVKALRAVARIKGASERERVPMNKIAQNVHELMKIGIPDGVSLRYEPDAQDPIVLGFSSELHQVVLNLAKNAVEATTPAGGNVLIAIRSTPDKVELRVSDEGEGMGEEVRRRLFTPFFTTKGSSGTGLGLSIVGSIVKDHSGEIEVESTLGKGTTFRVILPRA